MRLVNCGKRGIFKDGKGHELGSGMGLGYEGRDSPRDRYHGSIAGMLVDSRKYCWLFNL